MDQGNFGNEGLYFFNLTEIGVKDYRARTNKGFITKFFENCSVETRGGI